MCPGAESFSHQHAHLVNLYLLQKLKTEAVGVLMGVGEASFQLSIGVRCVRPGFGLGVTSLEEEQE